MTHVFRQRGGATIGAEFCIAWRSGWPSAYITVTENSIILGVWWGKHYFFDKAQISSIRKYKGLLFSEGVQIFHTKEDYPPYIIFWSLQPKELWRKLEQLGYLIDDKISEMSIAD